MFQYNLMDASKGVGSVDQRPKQYPASSADANVRPPEVTASGSVRPVLNYSSQTGEEFALEFMRERAMPKKPTVQNASNDQNMITNNVDMICGMNVPHMGSESMKDPLKLVTGDDCQLKEIEKNFSDTEQKGHYAPSRSIQQISSGEGSSRTVSNGYTPAQASDILSRRMKFLCSFGGKILPRPSDGKLRYVGGNTRIIRISRDISWEEFMQKTMAIYSRPHTIKYQLPGEDLDALISVSCDEDLQNMMEEHNVLEGGEGSQKLRLFLIIADDVDDVHFSLGSVDGDSEIQYVVAINDIDLGSGKSSYGHGLASTSTSDLDQLLDLNVESGRANAYTVAAQSAGFVTAPVASPAAFPSKFQASLSTHYDSHPQGFEDHRYHYVEGEQYAYNSINPPNRYQNLDSIMSIPMSVTSDYQYRSNHTDSGASVQPVQQFLYQGITQDPYSGVSPFDKEPVKMNVKLAVDDFSQRKMEGKHVGSHVTEPISTVQQHDASVSSCLHAKNTNVVSVPENLTSVLHLKSKGKQLEPASVSSAITVTVGHGSDLNIDDHYPSSETLMSAYYDDEADMTEGNYKNPPSHPSRGYQSERLPREQVFLNRLSKSDDSIGSNYLINQACLIAAQESVAEATDTILEGEMGAQTEKPLSSAKPPRPSNASIEDKKVRNAINQANKFRHVSIVEGLETAKFSQPMTPLINQDVCDPDEVVPNSVVQTGPHQTDVIIDEKTYKQAKIDKPELQHAPTKFVSDKTTVVEDGILQETSMSRHMQKVTNVGDTDMTKINIREAYAAGALIKPQEGPVIQDIPWDEKPNNDSNNNDVVEPAFTWVETAVAAVSQEESSAPSLEQRDILVDINDRFPPNLLSDIFSKARNAENLSNINLLRKDDTGLSLNMQNHEPQRWSFFRNLAQDEFNRKDFSLMDQDHINYPAFLPTVEEGISRPYQLSPLENERTDFGQIDSQINFSEEMQDSSSTIVEDPNALHPGYIPSQVSHHLGMDKGEGLQVENPFTKLGETLRTHMSENEVIKHEDLEELRELGSGTFGAVYHGKWRGTDVAIKRIKKSCFTGRSSEQERLTMEFWREAEILSQLHHPNVVAFYWLTTKDIIQVGDFGLSKIRRNTLVSGGVRGTLPWMAPELLNGSSNKVSEKVDVFSFGIVMWEILTGEEPYANMHYGAIIGGIVNNTLRPPVPATCDPEWRRLMEQCWAPDPSQRPSFSQIAGHLRAMSVASQAKPTK
ncbi:Protein kinase domain containing protein [Musa troglodytarum]|uniref:Protein kinase domain containing protein n=1 Tax=Musa troglodytarum TaxID=320322 RepID=A0A9E7JJF3_9LILI|nr:Protein kinase domain containing protein [Musa troglodytarum]URD83366.1 Protein kinase domain containing protein [Musa troglodytarum]URD83368.1 Protein kinase domain containing protein [Musa troglodytarum]URD83370.1 Protein kinase domain containing protein [Musa troglodytarum]